MKRSNSIMERRPPPPGLDPVQLVRERRLGLPNDQTPSPARRPSIPVVIGFGAAMEQYLADERAIRREQEIADAVDAARQETELVPNVALEITPSDSGSDYDDSESDYSDSEEENNHTAEMAINQEAQLHDTQAVHHEFLREDTERIHTDEYALIDGVVTDITQQDHRIRSPIVSSNDEDWYFEQDGQPLQAISIQQNELIGNSNESVHTTGQDNISNNTPMIDTPIRRGNHDANEELISNLVTNRNIGINTNRVMNRIDLPSIPVIHTPNMRAGITTNNAQRAAISPIPINNTQRTIPPIPTFNAQRAAIPPIPINNTQRIIPPIPTVNAQRTVVPPVRVIVNTSPVQREAPPMVPNQRPPFVPIREQVDQIRNNVHQPLPVPVISPHEATSFEVVDPRRPAVPRIRELNQTVAPATVVLIRPPPTQNLYLKLPHPILDAIARDRDIALTGDCTEQAMQLFELDNIMPDWIQSIMTKTIGNFQVLVGAKLYVFGALNGVNFIGVPGLSSKELIHYIRVSILLANPAHPETRFLPTILRECSRDLIELFSIRFNIHREELRFINRDDLEIAILTGRRDHIQTEYIAACAARFQLLYNHKYKDLLANLYQINIGDEDNWVSLARLEAHPMEHMIINLDQFKLGDIVDQLKMAVPLSFANNAAAYVRSNIVSYSEVLTRANIDVIPIERLAVMRHPDVETYLSKLTDQEIHNLMGVYVSYNSRVELIQNTITLIHTPSFFYPTVRLYQRARNRETINLTDITDLNVFMIAYGTMVKYDVYELDDIIGAFTRDTETGLLSFRHPENQHVKFTVQEVEGLRRLLMCFSSTPGIIRIIELIDQGLIDFHEKLAQDDEYMEQLRKFPVPTKQLIQQFLRQVFYIGMYMRRWRGPGYPFPLKKSDTQLNISELELDTIVKKQIEPAVVLLDQMGKGAAEYCLNFRQCEYNQGGTIDVITEKFNEIWHRVGSGKQCIRMASSIFVGTGYHYLRVLFRETIPNINVRELAKIV